MSERPKSRKRNEVEGTVSEIKKQERGLGLGKVGEGTSFVSKMFSFFKRGRNYRER
ncbi:MAG: hypothetical protein IJF87_04760 [Erysipelotrichaceae bacterium]|nr:hypothetical protein [Erysipelotrichaceae bacterium]